MEGVLSLPLSRFADRDLVLSVEMPGEPGRHYFVSGAKRAAELVERGIPRGVVWTAEELRFLLAAGHTPGTSKAILDAKRIFQGTVVA